MRVIRGIILMKAYPIAPHVTWNMGSVDFIAVCIGLIVDSMCGGEDVTGSLSEPVLRAYNLSHPGEGVPFSQLMSWIHHAGYPLTERSYEGWKLLLEGVNDSHPLAPLVGFFQTTDRFPHIPLPTCSRMKALIAASTHPVSSPPFDQDHLVAMLSRMHTEGFLPAPVPPSSRVDSSLADDSLSVFSME